MAAHFIEALNGCPTSKTPADLGKAFAKHLQKEKSAQDRAAKREAEKSADRAATRATAKAKAAAKKAERDREAMGRTLVVLHTELKRVEMVEIGLSRPEISQKKEELMMYLKGLIDPVEQMRASDESFPPQEWSDMHKKSADCLKEAKKKVSDFLKTVKAPR